MASRPTEFVRSRGKGYTVISGSFAPDSANTPTAVKGAGFTVVWTSTGTFTITFDEKYYDLISANATLQLASADDKFVQVGTYTAASKTLVIRCLDNNAGTISVADITANANNRINFHCVFKNSAIWK